MRILQVAPQHRQRHDQHKQQPKRPLLRLVKGAGRATVAPQPRRAHKQRERAQGQPVRRIAEAHRIGPQNGQPHQQKHAQRQAQINAQHGLEPGQEQPCNHCATREKQHQIHDGKQAPSSLYAQHGAEELHRGLERSVRHGAHARKRLLAREHKGREAVDPSARLGIEAPVRHKGLRQGTITARSNWISMAVSNASQASRWDRSVRPRPRTWKRSCGRSSLPARQRMRWRASAARTPGISVWRKMRDASRAGVWSVPCALRAHTVRLAHKELMKHRPLPP